MNNLVELKSFAREVARACNEAGIVPIIYGSFAYVHYTKDKKYKIGDIDFYIPEKSYPKVLASLKKRKMQVHYYPKEHTIHILNKKLKVELDSLDYWYKGPKNHQPFDFGGPSVKILSLAGLKSVYRKASKISDRPEMNSEKYSALKNIDK